MEIANEEDKIKKLIDIGRKNNKNKMTIIYKIDKTKKKIKLFGRYFVFRNKNVCRIIYNNKQYNLKEYFNTPDNEEYLRIKLTGILEIIDLRDMFAECNLLYDLPDISKIDTKNIKCMSNLFYNCSSLSFLPKNLPWDTKNVTEMTNMFSGCCSLSTLPDISEWNLSNVTDMYGLFGGCSSLQSLPDISNWDISNAVDIGGLFNNCSSLLSLPDISKWNTSNATDISGLFFHCSSLISLQIFQNGIYQM